MAFTAGIRNPILNWLARRVLYLVFGLAWVYLTLFRKRMFLDVLRERLLGPEIIPTTASRAYIYSATDPLVPAAAVEAHADAAKKLGLDVTVEKYDSTPHVNHVRLDPERYWNVVKSTWVRGHVKGPLVEGQAEH